MGGGGGGSKTYRSPYLGQTDELGLESILNIFSGLPIAPSPTLNASMVAQSLGGTYDNKKNIITLPDRSQIQYDTLSGQFVSVGGKSSKILSQFAQYSDKKGNRFTSPEQFQNYVKAGNQVYQVSNTGRGGQPLIAPVNITPTDLGGSSQYLDAANKYLNEQITPNVYGPNSAYSMFGDKTFGATAYNPETGQYEPLKEGKAPPQITGDYYLNKFGDYLNQDYDPYSYDKAAPYQEMGYEKNTPYNEFDYTGKPIQSVDNVDEALVSKMISQGQDQINRDAMTKRNAASDFVAAQGGSLGSGRAAKLFSDIEDQAAIDRQVVADKARSDQALRSFYDAQSVRDQQAAQDQTNLQLRGGEARYAQDTAAKEHTTAQAQKLAEHQKAFDTGFEENKLVNATAQGEHQKVFDTGQEQGKERMGIATATDSDAANRAAAQQEANQQMALNRITALQNMLGIYSNFEGTYGQLEAAKAQAAGQALAGLYSGIGSAVGGGASAFRPTGKAG